MAKLLRTCVFLALIGAIGACSDPTGTGPVPTNPRANGGTIGGVGNETPPDSTGGIPRNGGFYGGVGNSGT